MNDRSIVIPAKTVLDLNDDHRPVDCITQVIQHNVNKLLRVAAAVTGNMAEAEDIVQDAFVRYIEKTRVFESATHQTAWLIRVTVNLAKNRLRSHWWKKTVPLLDTHPARTSKQLHLMEAVLALPSKYRVAIHLFYYEGYATKEIAEMTAQRESTVRAQLTRARRLLKDQLESEGATHERI
ncbi:MAG: sigma-70 family RNA polymerase sigma factor [Defluviitaleaceae bacterium]|nr:sigma-70 family RNA polymerase sigma factor [Defluviitaleaceae bacterium]